MHLFYVFQSIYLQYHALHLYEKYTEQIQIVILDNQTTYTYYLDYLNLILQILHLLLKSLVLEDLIHLLMK